jgi:hypothetical protein
VWINDARVSATEDGCFRSRSATCRKGPDDPLVGHRTHVVALGSDSPAPTAPEEAVIKAVDPDPDPGLGAVIMIPGPEAK